MSQEVYQYGQGKVEIAPIVDGVIGAWRWLGDVSAMTLAIEEAKFSHNESYSGEKSEVREIVTGVTCNGSITLQSLSAENVAQFTRGTNTEKAAGTVSEEPLGTVAAGDVLVLDDFGLSNIVVIDSTGTPATIDPSHYEYDGYNELTFNSLPDPAPTMPLKVSYSHTAYKRVALLNGQKAEIALRYKGINLAEGNKKQYVEFYKVSPGLLQNLELINNGQQLAQSPVSFKPLRDTSKPADGELGKFAQVVTVDY